MIEPNMDRPDEFQFYRARIGQPIPVPEHLWIHTRFVANRDEIISAAVERMFEIACSAHPASDNRKEGRRLPVDIIAEGMGLPASSASLAPLATRRIFWSMCDLALKIGQQDTRYWGVTDPEENRYCARCRKVRPVSWFQACEYICRTCSDGTTLNWRNATPEFGRPKKRSRVPIAA